MRAVNLIPEELRPRVPGDGDPRVAYAVLGGLAVLLVMVLLAISSSNKLQTIEDQTASITSQTTQIRSRVAAVQTSPDQIAADVKSRTLLVGGLAKTRFPWGEALYDLSRSLPKDTTLTTIGVASAGSGGTEGEAQGASMTLAGCTSGWVGYSRLMTWLKLMPGVAKVESSASAVGPASVEEGSGQQTKNCGPMPLTFGLVVHYSPRTLDLTGLPRAEGGPSGATGAVPAAGVPAAAPAPAPAPAGGQ